jgi:predicted PurR-regulated permease PerM
MFKKKSRSSSPPAHQPPVTPLPVIPTAEVAIEGLTVTPALPLTYTQKILIAVTISVAAILLTAFVYYAADIIILCFAGLLFAVFLSAPSDLLSRHARIPRTWALAIVLFSLALIVLGGSYFMGYTIYKQSRELMRTVPGALAQFEANLEKSLPAATGPAAASESSGPSTQPSTTLSDDTPDTLSQWLAEKFIEARRAATDFFTSASFVRHAGGLAGGVVSSTFGLIGNAVVIFGVGLFFALSPRLYINGVINIFPIHRRKRVARILAEVGTQLQWWFVGQLCSMGSIGVLTFIGLKILGVPMAVTLGILAGLMNFIPNFGPILAAIPAVLVAFAPHGNHTELNPALAGYTIVLYVIIQLAEGWVITPFFQKRAVELPPALIVISQMLFALMLGPIGLILATPLLAATLVLLRMVYLEDILGDTPLPARHAPG